jgi:protein-ribulosamine 3-kinase
MLTDELKKAVEKTLSIQTGKAVIISETTSIGGGCINEAYSLQTNAGKYFIKFNSAAAFPGMFEKEAAGLKILSDSNTIPVPEIICANTEGKHAYLLLQFIETGKQKSDFWCDFGVLLSDLHQNTSDTFGLEQDNFIGSLVQENKQQPDFINFFISQRLEPQLKIARNQGALNQSDTRYFDSLFNKLNNIIPMEKPALLHGDLWSGNFMVNSSGAPCIFDPAVYYGHREADIAMTQLFGGFPVEFYQSYNEACPLEKDWKKRTDVFNLYPLLVHVNLFGGSYAAQVLRIIRHF